MSNRYCLIGLFFLVSINSIRGTESKEFVNEPKKKSKKIAKRLSRTAIKALMGTGALTVFVIIFKGVSYKEKKDHTQEKNSYNPNDFLRLVGSDNSNLSNNRAEKPKKINETLFPKDPFWVHVRTLTGKKIDILVEKATTIYEVKEQLEVEEGIKKESQRLIFAGKQLEDNRQLKDYNILADAELHLVLRLGPTPFTDVSFVYNQKTISLELLKKDHYSVFQEMAQKKTGIPLEDQLWITPVMLDEKDCFESSLHLIDKKEEANVNTLFKVQSFEKKKEDLSERNLSLKIYSLHNKKPLNIKASLEDKVRQLKSRIKEIRYLKEESQRLIFAGKQLEDNRQLKDYNILNHSKLYVTLRLGPTPKPMNFFYRGQLISIEVCSNISLEGIKKLVMEKTGVPTDKQLYLRGLRKNKNLTLSEFGDPNDYLGDIHLINRGDPIDIRNIF